jgi:hypothetical protein
VAPELLEDFQKAFISQPTRGLQERKKTQRCEAPACSRERTLWAVCETRRVSHGCPRPKAPAHTPLPQRAFNLGSSLSREGVLSLWSPSSLLLRPTVTRRALPCLVQHKRCCSQILGCPNPPSFNVCVGFQANLWADFS